MKILVLAPQPFFQDRGTPIAVRLLVEILAANGHEVHLLVFHEGEDIAVDNLTIHRIPALPGLGAIAPGFSVKKICCDALMAWKALRLARRHRFAVCHAVEESVFIAMALRRLCRIPYIYDLDSWMSDQLLDKLPRLERMRSFMERFEKAAVRKSIGVVPVCLALEEKVRSFDSGKPLQRLEDISLLSDDDGECRERLREQLAIDGSMAMYVGNLESYQGIGLLLEAFARIDFNRHDCSLVCIGGRGEDIEKYAEQARLLGIGDRVHLIGPRPVGELGGYLRQADLLVSPRIQGENTPMKIYSYMDSGRPVLATRITSHTQVLDDTNAFLTEPRPEAMAAALTEILADPLEGGKRAEEARRKVAAEYSRAAYERKVVQFYERLTNVWNLRI